jgi:cytochrome c553
MRKIAFATILTIGFLFAFSHLITSPQGQVKKEEDQFMKLHKKEMTPFLEKCIKCHSIKVNLSDKKMKKTFVEKCAKCHSLDRLFSKKRSVEEWNQVLKIMEGKPHANLSEDDLKKIGKWIDFMRAVMTP